MKVIRHDDDRVDHERMPAASIAKRRAQNIDALGQ